MIFASLGSSSWLSSLVWIAVVACSGGVLVFVGLLMEKLSLKSSYSDMGDMRWQKLKGEIGWWILMVGIFAEVVSTGWFAIRGEMEVRQIRIAEVKNDPMNQLVFDVSARAFIILKGPDFAEVPNKNDGYPAAFMSLGTAASSNTFWTIGPTGDFGYLISDNFARVHRSGGVGESHAYVLSFQPMYMSAAFGLDTIMFLICILGVAWFFGVIVEKATFFPVPFIGCVEKKGREGKVCLGERTQTVVNFVLDKPPNAQHAVLTSGERELDEQFRKEIKLPNLVQILERR